MQPLRRQCPRGSPSPCCTGIPAWRPCHLLSMPGVSLLQGLALALVSGLEPYFLGIHMARSLTCLKSFKSHLHNEGYPAPSFPPAYHLAACCILCLGCLLSPPFSLCSLMYLQSRFMGMNERIYARDQLFLFISGKGPGVNICGSAGHMQTS